MTNHQNKGSWMAKCSGSLNDSDIIYDSSRAEPKRSLQWLMEANEADLFPNKKQAVDVPNPNSFSALLNANVSPWGNTSSLHSVTGHLTERLFDPETARTINFEDTSTESVGIGNMHMGRKVIEDPYMSDSTFGLSISHPLEDPRSGFSYGGIRKVKVSQVKDTDTMSIPHSYSKADDCSISMGLPFSRGDANMISIGGTLSRVDGNFIPGQPYNRVDNSEISMDHTYKGNSSVISVSQSVTKNDRNITAINENFDRGETVSMAHSFRETIGDVSIYQPYSKGSTVSPIYQIINQGCDNTILTGHSYSKVEDSATQTCSKIDNSNLSMSHSFSKGESNIISFGGFNDDDDINSSGRLICNYDLLMGQSAVGSEALALTEKRLVDSNADTLTSATQITAAGDSVLKKRDEQKTSKKAPPNNFPSNVRSLLSTGMLDGLRVKYTAWSREKELHGIINGSGYLCGCQSCNFSKSVNAYEFERHAGCKTKHPNNHIYFENGKTIYGIVQELRKTPQNLLFEVIQTITGSPINQKSFRLWKESFLAATQELQRIYGKDDGKQFS